MIETKGWSHETYKDRDSSWDSADYALEVRTGCEAAFACGMKVCVYDYCSSVTVEVISNAENDLIPVVKDADWNGSVEGTKSCAACTLASNPCLRAGVSGIDKVGDCEPTNPDTNDNPCDFGCTPILVTGMDERFDLTNRAAGVHFDLDGDELLEAISWTASGSDESFLALDRNANGRIDNGSELFGGSTPQPSVPEPNGYLALAWYDAPAKGGNGDSRITDADEIFQHLLLWRDESHDGISQPSELSRLADSDILALDLEILASQKRDRHGNVIRWRSQVEFTDGVRSAAADVLLIHSGSRGAAKSSSVEN